MANLVKCRDCEHEISKNAKSCPSCGAPQRKRTHPITMVFGVLIIGSMAIGIFSGAGSSSYSNSNAATVPKPAQSSGLSGANTFCKALKETDFEIVCEPNSSTRSIRLVMHADNSEAQKICNGAVAEFKKYTNSLAGWSINIHTLYSLDTVAATCRF